MSTFSKAIPAACMLVATQAALAVRFSLSKSGKRVRRALQLSATTAFMMSFAGVLHAAPTYCAPGPNSDGLAVTNMKYNGANATDCYGVVSGIHNAAAINALNWGSDWSFLVSDTKANGNPNGTGSFMGVNFTLAFTSQGQNGNWTLTGSDTNGAAPLNLPAGLDLIGVMSIHSDNNGPKDFYNLYFFDNVVFDGNDSGTWTSKFSSTGDNPNLGSLSLYVRQATPTSVPEPATLGLLGLGLLGFAASRKQKRH